MKTYYVIAYRWGNLNEQTCLFASTSLQDCIEVADYYPDYRGGKYGCAVYESGNRARGMEGDGPESMAHYAPSLHDEKAPNYNHRCDVFNSTVCSIKHDARFDSECPQWIRDVISDAEKRADKLNEIERTRSA